MAVGFMCGRRAAYVIDPWLQQVIGERVRKNGGGLREGGGLIRERYSVKMEGESAGIAEAKMGQVVKSWETHHFCIGTSNYGYSEANA